MEGQQLSSEFSRYTILECNSVAVDLSRYEEYFFVLYVYNFYVADSAREVEYFRL